MAATLSKSAKVRLSAAVIGGFLNVLQAAIFLVDGYPVLAVISVVAVALFGVMAALLLRGHLRLGCSFPSVSVLFADIVGFTTLSSRLSSAELMARLNEVFTAFDALADQHGLENVASRMESHGEPGQIQVTEATRELISARFALRERGLIVVKGRGEMRTYFLDAPAS